MWLFPVSLEGDSLLQSMGSNNLIGAAFRDVTQDAFYGPARNVTDFIASVVTSAGQFIAELFN